MPARSLRLVPDPDARALPDRRRASGQRFRAASAARANEVPKVAPPRARGATVPGRLLDRLDEVASRRLVVLRAPPGAGKTTLAAAWLARAHVRAAWYRVDPSDEDPATLFHHLPRALERTGPRSRRVDLGFAPEMASSFDAFARRALRKLFERAHAPTIVFDDYHRAPRGALFHRAVEACIDELPAAGRVLVLSRDSTPEALPRLRLLGDAAEIGWDDLRLRDEEARAVLAALEAGENDPCFRERTRRAGGWVAGLLLGSTNRDALERESAYLEAEVLGALEPEERTLLARLSAPHEVSCELARALGSDGAVELLRRLAEAGWFVSELTPRGVYRMHDLLRETLQKRAEDLLGREEHRAHLLRAAGLLESEARIDEALEARLRAGATDEIALSVQQHGSSWLRSGRLYTVSAWLSRIPAEVVETQPWLRYLRAHELRYRDGAAALSLYDALWRELAAAGDGAGATIVLTELLETRMVSGLDFARTGELAREAIRFAGDADSPPSAILAGTAAIIGFLSDGDRAATLERGTASLACIGSSDELRSFAAYLCACLALVAADGGDGDEGRELLRRSELAMGPSPTSSLELAIQFERAMARHVLGELDRAHAQAVQVAQTAADLGLALIEHHGRNVSCWILITRGRYDETRSAIREMERLDIETPLWHGNLLRTKAWLALATGDARGAARHATTALADFELAQAELFSNMVRILLAAARAELGDAAAEDALVHEARWASEKGAAVSRFTSLVELAWIAHRRGDPAAGARLREAFALGAARRIAVSYAFRRDVFSTLCSIAYAEGIEREYSAWLIDLHDLPAPTRTPFRDAWPWRLEIAVLDKPRITIHGGATVELSGTKARRLLETIALAGGRDVPVEAVIDTLWPDSDEDRARQNLEFTLRSLRASLREALGGDEPLVHLASGQLGIDPCRTWIDVWELEARLARAETRRHSGDDAVADENAALDLLLPCLDAPSDGNPLRHLWRSRAERVLRRWAREADLRGDRARAADLRAELGSFEEAD